MILGLSTYTEARLLSRSNRLTDQILKYYIVDDIGCGPLSNIPIALI